MLKNYLHVAFRNLTRNGFYSLINIAGLSIGIACSVLILLWVVDELSFDRFHENYDRVYKVYLTHDYAAETYTLDNVAYPLKEAIAASSAMVKRTVLTNHGEGNLLSHGDQKVNKMALAVSEEFLDMFSFEVTRGDRATALDDPSSIVLTESTAKSLFGDEDPLNGVVQIDNGRELRVSAILRDLPDQASHQFDFLLPFAYFEATQEWVRNARENWRNNSFHVYVELQTEDAESQVSASIASLVRDHASDRTSTTVILHPMSHWRLFSDFENGKVSGGRIQYVRLFSGIAVFILAIACINFMNLATARSEKRAREVGIRKSIGSNRRQLISQFLGESIFTTLIAFVLAMMLVELTLYPYNILVGKQLSMPYGNPIFWLISFSLIVVTGVVAGSYPAFYLSSFLPVKVLKGKVLTSRGAATPRKMLVTLQFGFSIFLLIGTIVIYQQIMHVKNRKMGYDRENLMLVWTNSEMETAFPTIKEELIRTGAVKAVCKSSAPVTRIFSSADVDWPGKDPDSKVGFVTVATEYDYTATMGISMAEGRDFSPKFPSDTSAVIINRAAVELMGLEDPVGQVITMWEDERKIIGVMDDVIMGSPDRPVDPFALVLIPDWSSTISIRLEKTEDLSASIATVESIFKKLNPSFPLWYRFADAEFDTKFTSINLISRLAGIFCSLALFITCLGLFGLAAFTAEQRKKELGIRKVMGATISGLILLISKDFSRLILTSFVLAAPLAWWGLSNFLEQYPYRISIAWWVIPFAGLTSFIMAMIIVGTQAFRVAQRNPVDALRGE